MKATSGSARKESVAALVGNPMVPYRGTSNIRSSQKTRDTEVLVGGGLEAST